MAADLPEAIRLVRRAQRDLDALSQADRQRMVEDIVRLARREFPGEVKKIHGLPGHPFQADSGRFRILHLWQGQALVVLAIFARASQRAVFRSLRRP